MSMIYDLLRDGHTGLEINCKRNAKAIFSGTALPADESNATARNTMFELSTAGFYESAGLHTDISPSVIITESERLGENATQTRTT